MLYDKGSEIAKLTEAEQNGSCQELVGEVNEELLVKGHKVLLRR